MPAAREAGDEDFAKPSAGSIFVQTLFVFQARSVHAGGSRKRVGHQVRRPRRKLTVQHSPLVPVGSFQ